MKKSNFVPGEATLISHFLIGDSIDIKPSENGAYMEPSIGWTSAERMAVILIVFPPSEVLNYILSLKNFKSLA
jgi:hypothetical protein